MTVYRLARLALDDLDEILLGLAEHGGWEQSMQVEEKLFAGLDLLAANPGLGHSRTEIAPRSLTIFTVEPYRIIYDRDTSPILIHAILHGARDVKRILYERQL